MARVVALTGLAGAGKSTAAAMMMHQHDFRLVKFADPLKNMLKVLGLTHREIEGDRKGLPNKLLGGRSPRYAMQTLGTDWGRSLISDDLWVNVWRAKAKEILLDGHSVVCDDCRFENEASVIKDLGGEIWNIRRPAATRLGATGGLPGHASEAGIASRFAKVQINNDGTETDLMVTINRLLSEDK